MPTHNSLIPTSIPFTVLCQTSSARHRIPYTTCGPLPTKNLPAKIRCFIISGKSPMDVRIPPLRIEILLESNPLTSKVLVGRLGVPPTPQYTARHDSALRPSLNSAPKILYVRNFRPRRRHAAVFLLRIPEISVERLDESWIGMWSLEALNAILIFLPPNSRLWKLKYENMKYFQDLKFCN